MRSAEAPPQIRMISRDLAPRRWEGRGEAPAGVSQSGRSFFSDCFFLCGHDTTQDSRERAHEDDA